MGRRKLFTKPRTKAEAETQGFVMMVIVVVVALLCIVGVIRSCVSSPSEPASAEPSSAAATSSPHHAPEHHHMHDAGTQGIEAKPAAEHGCAVYVNGYYRGGHYVRGHCRSR